MSPSSDNTAPHIVVVGSINMDLVAKVSRLPRPGETVQAEQLVPCPGGKGANQAVAAARLGARSTMIGRVGDDPFGQQLVDSLISWNVNANHVQRTSQCSSGVAMIGVEESGENSITIMRGANGHLSADDLRRHEDLIASADDIFGKAG